MYMGLSVHTIRLPLIRLRATSLLDGEGAATTEFDSLCYYFPSVLRKEKLVLDLRPPGGWL